MNAALRPPALLERLSERLTAPERARLSGDLLALLHAQVPPRPAALPPGAEELGLRLLHTAQQAGKLRGQLETAGDLCADAWITLALPEDSGGTDIALNLHLGVTLILLSAPEPQGFCAPSLSRCTVPDAPVVCWKIDALLPLQDHPTAGAWLGLCALAAAAEQAAHTRSEAVWAALWQLERQRRVQALVLQGRLLSLGGAALLCGAFLLWPLTGGSFAVALGVVLGLSLLAWGTLKVAWPGNDEVSLMGDVPRPLHAPLPAPGLPRSRAVLATRTHLQATHLQSVRAEWRGREAVLRGTLMLPRT